MSFHKQTFHKDTFHQIRLKRKPYVDSTVEHFSKYMLAKPTEQYHRVSDRYVKSLRKFYESAFNWKTKKTIRKSGLTNFIYYDEDNDEVFTIQIDHPKERTYDVVVFDNQNISQSERDNYWK